MHRLVALFGTMFAFGSTAVASPCPGTNLIEDPADFQWTWVADASQPNGGYYTGVMEMSEETFTFANGETLTTRAYGQQGQAPTIPAPTMRVTPGNKYVLSFHNNLPYESPDPAHNVFKDANISNLHTHGLHISGESPGDDVTRSFEGGYGGDFVYDIPADHMGGTYWYHAHHHGSTYLQVAGGAFGMLLVDDSNDGIPASVASMEERQLAVAYLDPGAAGTGGDTLMTGTVSAGWTVNGAIDGNMCVANNEWQHWRILLADRDATQKTLTLGAGCEAKLLARDGVWRTVAPKDLTTNGITMSGASRADFAVRCTQDTTVMINNSPVANIYVDGSTGSTATPYDGGTNTWSATRPDYLRDLRGETGVNTESVKMGARTVNGTAFDANVPTFTLPADSVQEWGITGAARHPFHLHVYHVQSMNCGGDFEDGEYYDVVDANCSVRFDMNTQTSTPYNGRTIMHCHILQHEDQGAMGWMDVVGGAPAPTFPSGAGFSEYYSTVAPPSNPPAAPTAASATATSSTTIDVAWTDNSSDEDWFDIERSLDGSSWSYVGQVGANVTSYGDSGLSSNTTCYYRVLAANGAGDSAWSNTASATTLDVVAGSAVQVRSITTGTWSAGRGNNGGTATIVVEDDQGNLISGAVVTGEFTGTFNEVINGSDPTNASGSTTVQTTGSQKGGLNVNFCVTGISHPTLTDFSANMGEVCASPL
ncbi:MAG: hypothetical protein EP330_19930 [Deltaproteobacteria bacterium]|nr:MAG: hypothetical protein EP330_19930 [Deltaproteobacteria bacterium]